MNARAILGLVTGVLLAAMPASNNFQLNSYGFGTGGTAGSSSTNYSINGIAGDTAGNGSSTNYKVGAGETYAKQANVPVVTISNPSSWYNKLKVVIDPQNNPADATFAVAISTDNFTTTQYVKNDFTVGSTLTQADYLTYAAWGSATGQIVRGLKSGTVYTVKAKAYRGKYTESGYGPTSSVATSDPQLIFNINVSASNTTSTPPYAVNFGNLLPGTPTNAPLPVWVNLSSNAESGGNVYVTGKNGGLRSATTAYTISAQSGDISSLAEAFGLQAGNTTQSAGATFMAKSPFNVTGNNIGATATTFQNIFGTTGPVDSAAGSVTFKAKSQQATPASSDYAELLTLVAAASF